MALTKIKADGLTADLIDETKLADNSIDSDHYNDGSIDNAHLADDAVGTDEIADNAITNALMADDAVGVAELSATGTASSSTFLRGDNSWVTPTDTNTQLAFANDANNRVVTGDGSGGLNGEANLTFDGTYFQVQHATAAIARVQNSTAATSQSASIELAPANGLLGHSVKSVSEEDFSTGANRTAYLSIEGRKDGTLTERLRIESGGNLKINDGDLVIGTAGHGIDFSANSNGPGTSVSELFHIYEEGYYTPAISPNLTLDSSYTSFQYTRVGRLVTVRGIVVPDTWSGSNGIYLSLPFAALNDADAANAGASGCMFRYLDDCTGGLVSYIGDNTSYMYFYRCESGNGNYTVLTNGHLHTNAVWYFSHTYAAA